ncbi:uncharacterized protein LOC126484668 [Schistocerca serialis cubense]|uniref:uncharacterized protein LOC126484668 n=1 Tax=Schistocerca serialis cubense TaxID=2023355 RepID=UPI00214F040F|nr:uncharacterized protein LOC126484668 [Schistocerca serialis cubense]
MRHSSSYPVFGVPTCSGLPSNMNIFGKFTLFLLVVCIVTSDDSYESSSSSSKEKIVAQQKGTVRDVTQQKCKDPCASNPCRHDQTCSPSDPVQCFAPPCCPIAKCKPASCGYT